MENTPLEILGSRIRTLRKARGWTQEQLAVEADVDRSYIGGIERGERNPTFTMLCGICAAMECDVADLTQGIPGDSQ